MKLTDFEEYQTLDPEEDLSPDEQSGLITLPAYAVFCDLAEMGQLEDFDPRYQITYRLPKGNEYAQKLFAVSALIAKKTWKGDTDEKLSDIWGCITGGVPPKASYISLQDGDKHKPAYNRNNWLVKASRREDEGRPTLYDRKGHAIFAPAEEVEDDDGITFITDGELVGDLKEVTKPGDYCLILMRVWAQKKRERLNFSVIGVRLVKRGGGLGKAAIAQQSGALQALANADVLPSLPAMPLEDTEAIQDVTPKRVAKKAGAKKSAKKSAKKAAGKSVFRSKRK